MPELPEVETIVQQLNSKLSGKKITAIEVKVSKMVNLSVAKFKKGLVGKKIKKVGRRAKMIIVSLAGDKYLLIHLKMTGQLIYQQKGGNIAAVGGHPMPGGLKDLPNKFTHIIFAFNDGSDLFYNDVRKFGWMKLADKAGLDTTCATYGIEPFTKNYTLNNFEIVLARYPKRKIKQLVLDQKLIAGVGNIYIDEACFCAKIKPTRIVGSLKPKEIKDLFGCLAKVMKLSIQKGGTSVDTYVQSDGSRGGFALYLKVYGRAGEKCKRCGGKIAKIKLNGRGTHYCPDCQK